MRDAPPFWPAKPVVVDRVTGDQVTQLKGGAACHRDPLTKEWGTLPRRSPRPTLTQGWGSLPQRPPLVRVRSGVCVNVNLCAWVVWHLVAESPEPLTELLIRGPQDSRKALKCSLSPCTLLPMATYWCEHTEIRHAGHMQPSVIKCLAGLRGGVALTRAR